VESSWVELAEWNDTILFPPVRTSKSYYEALVARYPRSRAAVIVKSQVSPCRFPRSLKSGKKTVGSDSIERLSRSKSVPPHSDFAHKQVGKSLTRRRSGKGGPKHPHSDVPSLPLDIVHGGTGNTKSIRHAQGRKGSSVSPHLRSNRSSTSRSRSARSLRGSISSAPRSNRSGDVGEGWKPGNSFRDYDFQLAAETGLTDWSQVEKRLAYQLADMLSMGDEEGFLRLYDSIPDTLGADRIEEIKDVARKLVDRFGTRD